MINNRKEIDMKEKSENNVNTDELNVTTIPNKLIDEITNLESLGIFVYILSQTKGSIDFEKLCNRFNNTSTLDINISIKHLLDKNLIIIRKVK